MSVTNKESNRLSPKQKAFIDAYMQHGNGARAVAEAGYKANRKTASASAQANRMINTPKIAKEIARRQEEMKKNSIASAQDVMEFFTKAMRGEIKDQFGLDATLGDRIRAGQELAKRTIDIENKLAGKTDSTIKIVLDWDRGDE